MTQKPAFFTKFTLHPRPGMRHILLTPHHLNSSVKPRSAQFRASLHSACRDTAPKLPFDATTPRAPPISANARVGNTVPFFIILIISLLSFAPVRHLAQEFCSSPYPKSQSCRSEYFDTGSCRTKYSSLFPRSPTRRKQTGTHSLS